VEAISDGVSSREAILIIMMIIIKKDEDALEV